MPISLHSLNGIILLYSYSDSGGGKYSNVMAYRDRKNSSGGQIRRISSTSNAAFRAAILEAENAVASSKDALRTASVAFGSPVNTTISQTATVQPLQQLQQQGPPQPVIAGKVTGTSASSPSPSSSASSSAPTPRK